MVYNKKFLTKILNDNEIKVSINMVTTSEMILGMLIVVANKLDKGDK